MTDFATLGRAIRSLRRVPGYVAVCALSLGVALGLTTATFALVDGTLHQKVRFADPARLFYMDLRYGNQHQMPTSDERMEVLRNLPAVQAVAVTQAAVVYIRTDGLPRRTVVRYVMPNVFAMASVKPRLGRYPIASEIDAERAVVVSSKFWTDEFANRPAIDDATVSFDGHIYSVVGVLPTGNTGPLLGDVIVPEIGPIEPKYGRAGTVVVRIRPGFDSLAVHAQLATAAAGLTSRYVSPNSASPRYVIDLVSYVPKPPRLSDNVFELLLVAIAFGILLIGCTNVAALGLARGLTRRRDLALRLALGASRASIAADVIGESLVIAVLGVAIGAGVAVAMVGVLTHLVPSDLAKWGMFVPSMSGWVFSRSALALTAGMLVAAGIPAWRASWVSPADPLKDAAGTTTGRSRNEFRVLVISELAVAMVLLMLTSLVALSTRNILHFDYGFDDSVLLAVSPVVPPGGPDSTAASALSFENMLARRLRTVPGVAAAAVTGVGTLYGGELATDEAGDISLPKRMGYVATGPGFFATAGIPLVSGRDVTEGDAAGGGAIVLSRSAQRLLFPHGGALGRMVKLGGVRSTQPWIPVIGIAKDVNLGLSDDPTDLLQIYAQLPASDLAESPTLRALSIIARAPHVDAALIHTVQRDLQDVLPANAGVSVASWASFRADQVRQNLFFERLLSMLSFSALILGAIGLFSVMSYSVGQRMREFAVRQALGATPRNIVRVVLTGAFEMVLGGTAVGALLSFWASAGLSWGLFGVKNTDPVSLVIAEMTLMAVAMGAALVPALRAMRADPVEILRSS